MLETHGVRTAMTRRSASNGRSRRALALAALGFGSGAACSAPHDVPRMQASHAPQAHSPIAGGNAPPPKPRSSMHSVPVAPAPEESVPSPDGDAAPSRRAVDVYVAGTRYVADVDQRI